MKPYQYASIDEINPSEKSTKENENICSPFLNLEDDFMAQEEDQKSLNAFYQIFTGNSNNIEFDDLSYDKSEGKENIDSTILGRKRVLKDNSITNFNPINIAKENVPKEKIFEINKIFKNNEPVYRLDYYKKLFIKNFLNYLLNYGKKMIVSCNFGKMFGYSKLHMPNYKLYAGNPKEKDNRNFLKKTIKEVFMDYDKTSEKGTGRQKNNEKLINKIYAKYLFPNSENEKCLKKFFEMNIEKGIELYYESEEFQKFKNDGTNQYYDKMFYNEKNRKFSLLEKNGFIKLVNMPFYSKFPK